MAPTGICRFDSERVLRLYGMQVGVVSGQLTPDEYEVLFGDSPVEGANGSDSVLPPTGVTLSGVLPESVTKLRPSREWSPAGARPRRYNVEEPESAADVSSQPEADRRSPSGWSPVGSRPRRYNVEEPESAADVSSQHAATTPPLRPAPSEGEG